MEDLNKKIRIQLNNYIAILEFKMLDGDDVFKRYAENKIGYLKELIGESEKEEE